MLPVRPTLRVLREDLGIPLPSVQYSLNDLDHPLLVKARAQFIDDGAAHERINAIDDQVLLKVKVQRWRGAVWVDEPQPWLVAAGTRKEGSPDDFYAGLERQATAARARFNAANLAALRGHTYVGDLLPTEDDHTRYQLEQGLRFRSEMVRTVQDLTAGSLRDGHEHAADYPTFRLGILTRADEGYETYVAVRITGTVPDEVVAVILRVVPGCDPETWWPEASLPARQLMPAEQAWSTFMDPKAAAQLLDCADEDAAR